MRFALCNPNRNYLIADPNSAELKRMTLRLELVPPGEVHYEFGDRLRHDFFTVSIVSPHSVLKSDASAGTAGVGAKQSSRRR